MLELIWFHFSTIDIFQTDQPLELSEIGAEGKEQCIIFEVDAPFYNDPAPPKPSDKKSDIDSKKDKALMGLWDYEVVEAFFLCSKSEQYLEVEVGPHGHHLVLFLNGRKNIIKECLPIKWEVEIGKSYPHFLLLFCFFIKVFW